MCRAIRPLFNFEPAATEEDVREAARQFVRKISGFNQPSKVNEAAFNAAVEEITRSTTHLLAVLETRTPPRPRPPRRPKPAS